MSSQEIFDSHVGLITINILGRDCEVPANDSILRCLQFLSLESVSESELCWNGDCLDCQVWIKQGDKEKSVLACRTNAEPGIEIVRISEKIRFESSD